MLTLQGAMQHIKHALGGSLIEDIDPITFVNEAGQKLVSMHGWNWMRRPQFTLGQIASQEYISLPPDFGEVITIEYSTGLTSRIMQTSFEIISKYRSLSFASPGYLMYVAVVSRPDVDGIPVPVLDVYPTPTTTDPAIAKLYYRARWTDLVSSDQAKIPIPNWMEPLYIQILRAVAKGYQADDVATMSQRLTDVIGGPDWLAAIRSDSNEQTNLGPMRGGWLDHSMGWNEGEWLLQNQIMPPTAT